MVGSANDDEILGSTADEQLFPVDE